nr:MAG TPA: hypothetical protein [Caudoviricetes sp.]
MGGGLKIAFPFSPSFTTTIGEGEQNTRGCFREGYLYTTYGCAFCFANP